MKNDDIYGNAPTLKEVRHQVGGVYGNLETDNVSLGF